MLIRTLSCIWTILMIGAGWEDRLVNYVSRALAPEGITICLASCKRAFFTTSLIPASKGEGLCEVLETPSLSCTPCFCSPIYPAV